METGSPKCATHMAARLFYAQASPDAQEAQLRKEFEKYGKVRSVQTIWDKDTGKNSGCGYIVYETLAEAVAAAAGLHGNQQLAAPGCCLAVASALPAPGSPSAQTQDSKAEQDSAQAAGARSSAGSPVLNTPPAQEGAPAGTDEEELEKCARTVYFARVPPCVPMDALEELFSRCGPVVSVNLFKPWATSKTSKGCGLVEFVSSDAANMALKTLNNLDFWEGARYPLLVERMLPSSCKPPKQAKVAVQAANGTTAAAPTMAKCIPGRNMARPHMQGVNGPTMWHKPGPAGDMHGSWGNLQAAASASPQMWGPNAGNHMRPARVGCPQIGSMLSPAAMRQASNGNTNRGNFLLNQEPCLAAGHGGELYHGYEYAGRMAPVGPTSRFMFNELQQLNRAGSMGSTGTAGSGMGLDPGMSPDYYSSTSTLTDCDPGVCSEWGLDMPPQVPMMPTQMAGYSEAPLDWPLSAGAPNTLMSSPMGMMPNASGGAMVQPSLPPMLPPGLSPASHDGSYSLGSWPLAPGSSPLDAMADLGTCLAVPATSAAPACWAAAGSPMSVGAQQSLQVPIREDQMPTLSRHLNALSMVTKATATLSVAPEGGMSLVLTGNADTLAAAHALVTLMLSEPAYA